MAFLLLQSIRNEASLSAIALATAGYPPSLKLRWALKVQPLIKSLHYHHAIDVGENVFFKILAVNCGDNGSILNADHKCHIIH